MKKIALFLCLCSIGIIGCSSRYQNGKNSADNRVIYYKNHKKVSTDVGPDTVLKLNVSDNISRIQNNLSLDVRYVRSTMPQVVISGPKNVINALEIKESGVTLKIDTRENVWSVNFSEVKVEVSMPVLDEVVLNGSGDFFADKIVGPNVNLTIMGSGDIEVGELVGENVKYLINGSGDLSVRNTTATQLQCLIQGSGDISLSDISTTTISSIINGSGDIGIKKLMSTLSSFVINGAGDISVKGETTTASFAIYGTGDINAGALKYAKSTKECIGIGSIKTP